VLKASELFYYKKIQMNDLKMINLMISQ